jgi:hypothetical protein
MLPVADIEFVEVGISFSAMVNFVGFSLLILFVSPLTAALSPKGQDFETHHLHGKSKICSFSSRKFPF